MANIKLVADPTSAEHWNLTIHEAVQIALMNSRVVRNLGLQQGQFSEVDNVRAVITRYDPLSAAAAAEAQWGIFDPVLGATMDWDHQDIPPGTSFAGIGARPPRLDTADFDASLSQLLPTGGQFRTDWVTQYLLNPDHPPTLDPNPQYFSYQQFGLTQPLCQGRGPDVTMASIRIASAQAEQTDWRFKQEILALVRSVKTTYWQLYAQQQDLKVVDEVLPMFREIVRVRGQQAQSNAGTETEVAQARSQMLLYEQRRFEILSAIAEQQLVLRDLLGLSLDDYRYMWLIALPAKTPPLESLEDSIATAINRRPDILRQRLAVYVAQQQTIVAGDKMRPQLDFNAFWRINGLGDDVGSSVGSVADNQFTDWHIGLGYQIPLGRRQARGNLRSAQFTMEKQQALLDEAAHQSSYEVADAYRRAIWFSQQERVADDRVAALMQWRVGAKSQFENPPANMTTTNALQLYLQNLGDLLNATSQANSILASFNSALARLEEVKGTGLEAELIQVDGDRTEELPPGLPTPQIQIPESVAPESSQQPSGPDATLPAGKPQAQQPTTPAPVEKRSALEKQNSAPVPHSAPSAEPNATQKQEPAPPSETGPAAPVNPPNALAPEPPSGFITKLERAGKRAGKAISPLAERVSHPLHWPLTGRDSEIAHMENASPLSPPLQVPQSVLQAPPNVSSGLVSNPSGSETKTESPSEIVSSSKQWTKTTPTPLRAYSGLFGPTRQPSSVATGPEAAHESPVYAAAQPSPCEPAPVAALNSPQQQKVATLPSTKIVTRGIQQPNLDVPDSEVAPPTQMVETQTLMPQITAGSEISTFSRKPVEAPEYGLAQQNEFGPLPSRPVQSPQRQRSELPWGPKTRTCEIQQPESIQLSSLPEQSANQNVYHIAARQSQRVSHAAPQSIRIPDAMLPELGPDRSAVPICNQRSINEETVAAGDSPERNLQMPDSALPASRIASRNRVWQPECVR